MKQHKWHKEIKAWADGADIEYRGQYPNGTWNEWTIVKYPTWEDDHEGKQYRIKQQPKPVQYLYVYANEYGVNLSQHNSVFKNGVPLLGKIKLEVDDE